MRHATQDAPGVVLSQLALPVRSTPLEDERCSRIFSAPEICRRMPATMARREDRAAAEQTARQTGASAPTALNPHPKELTMHQEFTTTSTRQPKQTSTLATARNILSATEVGDRKIRTRIAKGPKASHCSSKAAEQGTSSSCPSALSTRRSCSTPPTKTLLLMLSAETLPTGSVRRSEFSPSRPCMAGKPTRGLRLRVLNKPSGTAPAPKPAPEPDAPWPDQAGDPGPDFGEAAE